MKKFKKCTVNEVYCYLHIVLSVLFLCRIVWPIIFHQQKLLFWCLFVNILLVENNEQSLRGKRTAKNESTEETRVIMRNKEAKADKVWYNSDLELSSHQSLKPIKAGAILRTLPGSHTPGSSSVRGCHGNSFYQQYEKSE